MQVGLLSVPLERARAMLLRATHRDVRHRTFTDLAHHDNNAQLAAELYEQGLALAPHNCEAICRVN